MISSLKAAAFATAFAVTASKVAAADFHEVHYYHDDFLSFEGTIIVPSGTPTTGTPYGTLCLSQCIVDLLLTKFSLLQSGLVSSPLTTLVSYSPCSTVETATGTLAMPTSATLRNL